MKESVTNDYERRYNCYSKLLGLPSIPICSIPISKEKQYALSQGIRLAVRLKDSNNIILNLGCLAQHSALADFLKKGGRDFSNYLVYKDKIYAIDNEFLFNKRNIRKEEMNKRYNELFILENKDIQKNNLLDNLIVFTRNYHLACKKLNYYNTPLKENLKDFLALSPLFNEFNQIDRRNILKILNLPDFIKDEEKLISIINTSSVLLRKIIRQSSEITSKIFNYIPRPSNSINFDNKTLVLRKALIREIGNSKDILEIGPGCNATLSLFLKKNFPQLNITAIDLNNDFVKNAKKTAISNNLNIKIKSGNIVKGINDKFDLIFWNIPYVSSNVQHMKDITGGLFNNLNKYATEKDDGSRIITRFLNEAKANLNDKSKLIFASNTYYISDAKIKTLIKKAGLKIKRIYTQKNNTARAYVICL